MRPPGPVWTLIPLAFWSDVSSVGVNVWNAMSISPFCRASFIVEDFA